MELRPYQQEAVEAIERKWEEGWKRLLLVLPTGCGKTIVFSRIAADMVRKKERVLILAHRGELLEQAADKLEKSTGLKCAVEKAEQSCKGTFFRVVVGSVQTLMGEKRLHSFAREYFSTIIVDEAHHCVSDSYQKVLSYFADAKVLGVTATADRGDKKELGSYFEDLAYEYSMAKAIQQKYLCPIKAQMIPLKLDISNVSMQNGDFRASEIGSALDPYLEQIAEHMKVYCRGRKTVVFLPLIATSQKFRGILEEKGMRAAEVNGESQDRGEVLEDFDKGKYDVLCNSMLLTEGWDCPSVDCICVLRPTRVRGLYQQMVGRGTRLSPDTGKKDLLILDFLWHTERHELCRPSALVCTSEETAARMDRDLAEAGGAVDISEAEEMAENEVQADREAALAKKLEALKHRKKKLVDPLQFEMSIQAADLAEYMPAFAWQAEAPTQKQKEILESRGIDPDEIGDRGKATLIIDRLFARQAAGLSTPKQIRFLESKGFLKVGSWTFEDAKKMIDRIAANRWMVPWEIVPTEYVPGRIERGA